MILGIGIDLCEVDRMAQALEKGGFLTRYFTDVEQAYITGRGHGAAESMAGHFAAKEAALKALGCGIVLPLTDVAIHHKEGGAPYYVLTGKALSLMQEKSATSLHLSITHTKTTAAAVAILEA